MCAMAPELARALTALDPAELGARIKSARVAAGLTQPVLADSDVSVAYLSRIESGQRRPSPELLASLAQRLGVTLDYLVLGEGWEDARRLELQLDHAELSLVGGDADNALADAREVLAAPGLEALFGGVSRARYVEAAALDTLGSPAATTAFEHLLGSELDSAIRLKSATALCRIWREQGQLDRAIACAQATMADVPPEVLGSEEGIRLSVTLAAAYFLAGRTEEAAELCDRAIAEAERLSSPVARASAYWNASVIRSKSGDMTDALALAKRALHLLENTERVRDIGRLRVQLGEIMLRSDPPRIEDAKEQLRIADLELDWSDASPTDAARSGLLRAQALFLEGDTHQARGRAEEVLAISGIDMPLVTVEALILLGQVAWTTGEREEAHRWYREAITVLTGVGADREAGQVWFELGSLADQAGLADEARDAYRRAAASTGLVARLPVVSQPSESSPRSPSRTGSARLPVVGQPAEASPRATPRTTATGVR
jgi:transcriptional regulator with XRE-family HTH domain